MKSRLIACLMTVCMALTNGAPPNETSQDRPLRESYSLSYEYVIDNKILYSNCKDTDDAQKCKIYEKSIIEDKIIHSCDLELKTRDFNFVNNGSVLKIVDSHVIYSFKSKIITVNLRNCNVKLFSLDIDIDTIVEIFLHDDKYYVIFSDRMCKEFYCKAIYDSNGKAVKAATPLFGISSKTASDMNIKISNQGFLLNDPKTLHFYPYNDLDNVKVLFFEPRGRYDLSTLESKLGFCVYDHVEKVICQQYNDEGKIKIMETEIPIRKGNYVDVLKAFNVDKGMFAMVIEWEFKKHTSIDPIIKRPFFTYIDENGKQGKHIAIDPKCENNEFDLSFYRNSIGDYCVTYVCFNDYPKTSRNTKCFKKSELLV